MKAPCDPPFEGPIVILNVLYVLVVLAFEAYLVYLMTRIWDTSHVLSILFGAVVIPVTLKIYYKALKE